MTGWIEWHGGECPIPDAKAGEFEYKYSNDSVYSDENANDLDWYHGEYGDIIAYRFIEQEGSDLDWLEAEIRKLASESLKNRAFSVNERGRNIQQGKCYGFFNVLNLIKQRKGEK
jgi:hypothetical protein